MIESYLTIDNERVNSFSNSIGGNAETLMIRGCVWVTCAIHV